MKEQTTNDLIHRMQTSLNMAKTGQAILQKRIRMTNWMIVIFAIMFVIGLLTAPPCASAQSREQEQQIIHGAGGCTPNFSTGGCL